MKVLCMLLEGIYYMGYKTGLKLPHSNFFRCYKPCGLETGGLKLLDSNFFRCYNIY